MGRGNPCALLVGMQTGAIPMDNNMDYMVVLVLTFYIYFFKYNPAISLLDIYLKKMKKKKNSKIL